MKTFNQQINDFVAISQDSSASAMARTLLAMGINQILNFRDWSFNRGLKRISTGTGVQEYEVPYNALKIDYVKTAYGNWWSLPQEVKDSKDWRILNATIVNSSVHTHWNISDSPGKIGLFPIPIDSKGTVEMVFTKKHANWGESDYSTGSINASANGTIFSGVSGASWGSAHIGRYLQVGGTNTPADGFWFEITQVTTTGSIYVKESIPNNISLGTYTISQLIPFPDGFETIPLYFTLEMYYKQRELAGLSQQYGLLYREGLENLKIRDSRSTEGLITKQYPISQSDPNTNPWQIGTII